MDILYTLHFSSYDLFIIWIIWLLLIFSIAIGIERMIKIIIWNYIISIIIIWTNLGINLIIKCLDSGLINYQNPDKLINLLLNIRQILILSLYFILLIWTFYKSKLWVNFPENKIVKLFLSILFAPLTVINILTTLSIVILWNKILNPQQIIEFAEKLKSNPIIYKIILLFPLWLVLPGIVVIILSSEIKIPIPKLNFRFKKKKENAESSQEQWN